MRILIAEDDPAARRMLEVLLGGAKHELTIEANGKTALERLLSDTPPDIAIIDWMMPGLDGVDVVRQMRARVSQHYTYVILLTSKTQVSDVVSGLDAGADDYMVKPFNVNELHARLRVGERVVALHKNLMITQEGLRQQATFDALTGALNRGALEQALLRDIARAGRENESLSLLLIDLDEFKKLNDTLGHLSGDDVLREAARRMRVALRVSDVFGRYGGEEFLAVLPNCDAEGAALVGERVRAAMAQEAFATQGGSVRVSCSIGTISLPIGSGASSESLVEAADRALYTAKRNGRNQVAVGRLLPPPLPVRQVIPAA